MLQPAHAPRHRAPIARALLACAGALIALAAVGVILARPAEAAAPPIVTTISPALGPSVGGTTITITGTGFASGATVTIEGVAATSVTFLSSTSLTAVHRPAHRAQR